MRKRKLTTLLGCVGLFFATGCGAQGGVDVALATDSGASADGVQATDAGGDGGGTSTDTSTPADAAVDASTATDTSGSTGSDAAKACGKPTGQRPARRSEHGGVFDEASGQLTIFGGSFAIPQNCNFPVSTFEPETWVYDSACDAWEQIKGDGPPARTRQASVLRTAGEHHEMVLFGGRSRKGTSGPYTMHDDLWAFDLSTKTWHEIATTSTRPTGRANTTMVYIPTTDSLLVWGGNVSTSGLAYTPVNDIWLFSFKDKAWTAINANGPPSKRLTAGYLYDEKRQRMVVYGGLDETGFFNNAKYFIDLWALELGDGPAKWTRIDKASNNKPDGRFWAELARDKVGDRYFMFGGHDDTSMGNRNDLWAFTPDDGQWVEVKLGDTPNKPALGQCKFPPDFTKMDGESPERRYGTVFAAGLSGAWLVAGKTDCGIIDDLFYLDFKTLKWIEKTSSTVGNSCIRKGGLSCNDYCF